MSEVAVRVSDVGAVRRLTLCRPEAYNTITPQLRDELSAALDDAQRDRGVRVILLDAEGPAFCAGYALDSSTSAQAQHEAQAERRWDTAQDLPMIGQFAETWAKLHSSRKPTLAAVQGWCIAGGTNIVFNAHLILAAKSARFGYPPSRVWGVPEAPWNWVARMGLQRARRYMLTGDEFTAAEALEMDIVLDVVPDDELADEAMALAQRIAQVPGNQLEMITLALNNVADHQYDPASSRLLGTIFDGVARHSQEGADFVRRSEEVGSRGLMKNSRGAQRRDLRSLFLSMPRRAMRCHPRRGSARTEGANPCAPWVCAARADLRHGARSTMAPHRPRARRTTAQPAAHKLSATRVFHQAPEKLSEKEIGRSVTTASAPGNSDR